MVITKYSDDTFIAVFGDAITGASQSEFLRSLLKYIY